MRSRSAARPCRRCNALEVPSDSAHENSAQRNAVGADGTNYQHYTSGNMQSIQTLAQKTGVLSLTVISSAQGEQGYIDGLPQTRSIDGRPYLKGAVLAVAQGNPIAPAVTLSYGCSSKY
jgi:hypothetical protein